MKKTRFLLIIWIFSQSSFSIGQWKNMIPNYSFEKTTSDFPSPSTTGWDTPECGHIGDGISSYDYIAQYWSNVLYWTHPLKRDICFGVFTCPTVPTADLLTEYNQPTNGPARSGTNWGYTSGEYLIVPTKDYQGGGLQKNKTYYLEIFHRGNATKNLQVVNYKKQPKVNCGYPNKVLYKLGANKDHDIMLKFNASNSFGWTRYRTYFSPSSNKNWLSFGNSGEWDDLRIYEVQPNKCRTNWYFDNTVFNYPMEVFQASDKIYLGNGVDLENGSNHILGNVIQYANSKVVLRDGNRFKI